MGSTNTLSCHIPFTATTSSASNIPTTSTTSTIAASSTDTITAMSLPPHTPPHTPPMQTLAQSWSPLSSVYTTPVWPGSNQKLLNSKIVSDAQTLQQQPLQQQQQPQTKYQYLLCEPQPSQSAGSLSSITTTTHKPVRPLATLATPRLSLVPVGDASVVHSHVTNSCESLLLDLFTDPSVSASAFVLLQEQQLEGGCYCSIQQPPELESSLLQLLSPTSVRAGWTASHVQMLLRQQQQRCSLWQTAQTCGGGVWAIHLQQDPHQSSLPLTPTMSSSSSGATASSAIGLVALFPIPETAACSHVPTPSSVWAGIQSDTTTYAAPPPPPSSSTSPHNPLLLSTACQPPITASTTAHTACYSHPPSIAYDELFLDVLILPSYRSRGYATEAAKRVLMEHFAPSTFTASPVSHYTNPPLTVTPILPLSASSASIDSHSDIPSQVLFPSLPPLPLPAPHMVSFPVALVSPPPPPPPPPILFCMPAKRIVVAAPVMSSVSRNSLLQRRDLSRTATVSSPTTCPTPISPSIYTMDAMTLECTPPIITPTTAAATRVAEKLGMVPTRPRLVHPTNPDIHYDCHEINQQDFVDLWVQT
ncbi:hypothetical protein BASA83_009665 [Batrachochytrium salamandrivorans]|nr:hypothetical protein BASA83_009665 [Batrachochytrium salamandrivorans]